MKTIIHENSKFYDIGQVFSKIFSSSEIESYTEADAQDTKIKHSGHTVPYFLWIFVIIFSSIAVAVIIAETFF